MNRFKHLAAAALLLFIVLLAFVTVDTQNASKKPPAHSALPKRIVSIVPSNTEILFALGLEDRIVGVTEYCDYPAAAKKKPKVGDMNTNMERVIALKPDLVVAHGKLNDNLIKRLRSLGIRVLAPDPKTFPQVYTEMKNIGKATGRSAQAESIVKTMTRTVSDVKTKTAKSKDKKVLVVIQPNPLWAAGPNTFVDEMLEFSHASNIAHDAKPGFNQFSSEVAVTRNPDVIIVTRKEERDFIMTSPLWKRTNAVKKRNVHIVDGNILLRPGPRLAEGLVKVAQSIHPEAYK